MKPFLFRLQKLLISLVFRLAELINIDIPPFASASAIIENDLGKILVVNLSYRNGYALPGGLLKAGESFSQGLKREIFEETNLNVEIGRLVDLYHSYDQFPTVNALFVATITSGKLKSSQEGIATWQKPEDIIHQITYSDNRQAIQEYYRLK